MLDNGYNYFSANAPEEYNLLNEQEEFHQEVLEKINAIPDDTKASYFIRPDTGRVVKSEKEYDQCIAKGMSLKIVPYSAAVHALKQEEVEAEKRKERKTKRKRQKVARRDGRRG